jgi:hypothetical protein
MVPYIVLGIGWRGVVSFTAWPFYSLAPELVWTLWRRGKTLILAGN